MREREIEKERNRETMCVCECERKVNLTASETESARLCVSFMHEKNEYIGLCPVLFRSNVCPLMIPCNVGDVVFADKLWKM